MRFALIQMNPIWEQPQANMKKAAALVERAAKAGAELAVLPEMTLTGFSMNVAKVGENFEESKTLAFFRDLAKTHQIALIFGMAIVRQRKTYNTAVMIDDRGAVLGRYEKNHVFSIGGEHRAMKRGTKALIIPYRGFRIAPIICYDLRFVELADRLVRLKPDIVMVLANWPAVRSHHWHALLKARALDLQSFVAGVNRIGEGNGIRYSGQSSIIGPDGVVMLNAGRKSVSVINLTKQPLASYRKLFPFMNDL